MTWTIAVTRRLPSGARRSRPRRRSSPSRAPRSGRARDRWTPPEGSPGGRSGGPVLHSGTVCASARRRGDVAQLEEHRVRIAGVRGSSPLISTTFLRPGPGSRRARGVHAPRVRNRCHPVADRCHPMPLGRSWADGWRIAQDPPHRDDGRGQVDGRAGAGEANRLAVPRQRRPRPEATGASRRRSTPKTAKTLSTRPRPRPSGPPRNEMAPPSSRSPARSSTMTPSGRGSPAPDTSSGSAAGRRPSVAGSVRAPAAGRMRATSTGSRPG